MPNNSPGGTSGSQPPSLEKRLPIALALMMLVLLVSQYLFKPAPGPKPVKPVTNDAATASQVTAKPAPAPPIPISPAAGQIQASSVQHH